MDTVFQQSFFDCGATALANALRLMGVEYDSYKDVKIAAGTNRREGTSKRGIMRAVKFYGLLPTLYRTSRGDLAWKWLRRNAAKTTCICLCDDGAHWILASGTFNNHIIVVDPSDMGDGTGNAHYLSKEEALDRLTDSRGHYYFIKITRE